MKVSTNRRDFLKSLGFMSLTAAGLTGCSKSDGKRPNIVILLADDLGWGDVGYHGGHIRTPNIDRIAGEGVRLENFHACPLCSPTRAGLLTGRWPIRSGMAGSVITPWRQWGLPVTEKILADLAAEAGYERRGIFGKWHLGHFKREFQPLSRGFTHFSGHFNGWVDYFTQNREGERDWHKGFEASEDEGYTTDLEGNAAVQFIEDHPPGSPFFLYVPFSAPHLPAQAKQEDIAKYGHIEDEDKRIYAAMVDSLDQAIGRILKTLDDKGIAEETFVLFFSDNGATSYGDNGAWRSGKGSVYEGGIRVPAAVRWPEGIRGGRNVEAMMGYIDVYPTVKRLMGGSGSDHRLLDGLDMLDVIRGRADAPERDWFSYVDQGGPERASVCDGTWKLVVVGRSVLDVSLREALMPAPSDRDFGIELFRLDADPGEAHNVASEFPDVTARLHERLRRFRGLKIDGVPDYQEGRQGFTAPKDWVIED